MSAEPRMMIAEELEVVVRAVPGVVDIYPAGPPVSDFLKTGAQALGLGGGTAPILVDVHGDRIRVAVSIGVHVGVSATETARAVTEAVSALLVAHSIQSPDIQLTVVRIAEVVALSDVEDV
jgi:hypothetical protein